MMVSLATQEPKTITLYAGNTCSNLSYNGKSLMGLEFTSLTYQENVLATWLCGILGWALTASQFYFAQRTHSFEQVLELRFSLGKCPTLLGFEGILVPLVHPNGMPGF